MSDKIVINGEDAVLGRLASYVAKQALLGNEVSVVNSEKCFITGSPKMIVKKYRVKKSRGGYGLVGPFIQTTPDRILKRTIRSMMPYQEGRGRAMFKKIRCYVSIPKSLESHKIQTIEKLKVGKIRRGLVLGELSINLRGGK